MEDGLLSLKWNNHKSTFFHILSGLRKKETYTDATIACEGKFFPVHRLVMSTCSDYFGEVFERTTCKSPVVILKDIRHHDLEALLDYMYLGEVDVKQSDLAGLIKAAECLRIKGLAVPDEDPSLISKKSAVVPETRRGSSPPAKRTRRESGGSDGVASSYLSYGSSHKGGRRSISPSSSRSSAPTSISVPSQSVVPDTLHNPASSRTIVPPSPAVADLPPHHTSDVPPGEGLGNTGPQSLVPVEMIKVEVEDEGGSSQSHGTNSQSLRHGDTSQSHGEAKDDPPGGGGSERESGDRGRGGGKNASSSFSDFSSHSNEIEKEEHDQIDAYNEAEQLAGPSGVQGAPQIMNWGDEENNFPHNLFGAEDTSQQQVFGTFYEELLNDSPSPYVDGVPFASGQTSSAASRRISPSKRPSPSKRLPADIHAAAVTASAVAMQRGKDFYQCPLCPKRSKRRDHLRLHLRTHTGERPYACSLCPHRACQKSDLDKHLRTHLRR